MSKSLPVPDGSSLTGVGALVKSRSDDAITFVVNSQDDNERAEKLRQWVKATRDELEQQRRVESDPLYSAWKTNNGRYKPLDTLLDKAYRALGAAMAEFVDRKDREHTAALQATNAAYESGDLATAQQASALASAAAAAVVPSATSVRKKWVSRIVNAAAVPREWCDPAEKRIAAMARACKPDVPPMPIAGVEYTLEAVVTTRKAS